MPITKNEPPAIGIIGGSGLYQMEELRDATEHKIDTPFGSPSDMLVGGKLGERQVYFLPRHGRGHRILPHEINYRANIYALRSLNVRWIISVAAVGSLQEKYAPRDVVLPSQFYDRTSQRAIHTFFGDGIAAHVAFSEPISANLRNLVAESARSLSVSVHNGGTYVNMDGPAFSTRAESEFNRFWHTISSQRNLEPLRASALDSATALQAETASRLVSVFLPWLVATTSGL